MANSAWFEVSGDPTKYPNIESVRTVAQQAAKNSDNVVEVYRVVRTLVKTVQRTVTVAETDVP